MTISIAELKLRTLDFTNQESATETFFKQCGFKSAEDYYQSTHWSNQTIAQLTADLATQTSNIYKSDLINETIMQHSERMSQLMESYRSISLPNWIEELSEPMRLAREQIANSALSTRFEVNSSIRSLMDNFLKMNEAIELATKPLYENSSTAISLITSSWTEEHKSIQEKISKLINPTIQDFKNDLAFESYRDIINPPAYQPPINIPTYRETQTTLYARFETLEDKISNIEEHLFVEREIKNEAVKKTFAQSNINDSAFNELFESAKNRYTDNDLQVAIENIWAAFERIKTYFYSGKNNKKSFSADTLVTMIAAEFDKDFFDREFKELTTIGNNYRIRHHEKDKSDLSEKHIRYLFIRMVSLLNLCIEVLHEHESTKI